MERVITAPDAWRNVLQYPHSHWHAGEASRRFPETARARIAAGLAIPVVRPKFRIEKEDVFFGIGSCFARNIEEHLLYRGFTVRSMGFGTPRTEWYARPNGFINKFTTESILNELRWAFGEAEFPESSLVEGEGGWYDLQLAPGVRPVTRERALERRRQIVQYFRRIGEASVVVLTLGLVEAWYDVPAGVYLNAAPSLWSTRRKPERFELHVTSYAQNLAALEEILRLLRRHARAGLRVIVTVSPVPLLETFTGEDVITASTYSKSVLRLVADDVARAHDDVQYFPSYDAVITSNRSLAFQSSDERHVRDDAVAAITSSFLGAFGIDTPPLHPEFSEPSYVFANPDVYDAVASGSFASGYDHWLRHGRREGRPLRSENDPFASA